MSKRYGYLRASVLGIIVQLSSESNWPRRFRPPGQEKPGPSRPQQANDPGLARELVRQALNVFEEGVRRHYYLPSDIEPITSYIRQHVPIKLS